jgi:hypothetical protein
MSTVPTSYPDEVDAMLVIWKPCTFGTAFGSQWWISLLHLLLRLDFSQKLLLGSRSGVLLDAFQLSKGLGSGGGGFIESVLLVLGQRQQRYRHRRKRRCGQGGQCWR